MGPENILIDLLQQLDTSIIWLLLFLNTTYVAEIPLFRWFLAFIARVPPLVVGDEWNVLLIHDNRLVVGDLQRWQVIEVIVI